MWLVGFALLADLGGTGECESEWYVSYWGWYWAGMWRTPGGTPSSRACRNWRAVLGFTCISWILFLASSLVVRVIRPLRTVCNADDILGNLSVRE